MRFISAIFLGLLLAAPAPAAAQAELPQTTQPQTTPPQAAAPLQTTPPVAPEPAVQAYGAAHPDCVEWTDACVTCQRGAACSTPGIACAPGPIVCKNPGK